MWVEEVASRERCISPFRGLWLRITIFLFIWDRGKQPEWGKEPQLGSWGHLSFKPGSTSRMSSTPRIRQVACPCLSPPLHPEACCGAPHPRL